MSGISIRNPDISDFSVIMRFEAQFGEDAFSLSSMKKWFKSENKKFLILESENKPIGYAILFFRKNSKIVRLYSICIEETLQRKGYGKKFLVFIENYSKTLGMQYLKLECKTINKSGIMLYNSMGYSVTGLVENYYADGNGALLMSKKID